MKKGRKKRRKKKGNEEEKKRKKEEERKEEKERKKEEKKSITVIFSHFHTWADFPPKYFIILIMLREYLDDFVGSAISINLDKANEGYFFTLKFVNIIVEVIERNTGWTRYNGMLLLQNIGDVPFEESKKELVNIYLY
jgi:hypothetical protein